tara:strand:+ start:533 stop:991 length:459 start_codon:yes stop_codon:yes gene_type:complete
MKTLEEWLEAYAVSHQNKTNKLIHYFCVPAIYFSIVGLLMSIPLGVLSKVNIQEPILVNWAVVVLIPVFIFYARLSLKVAILVLVFSAICVFANYQISTIANLWIVSVVIFVIAWVFQFYGHHIEGKKPSFLKDIQFLLIGPAWILNTLFKK